MAIGETPIVRTILARLQASFADARPNAQRGKEPSALGVRASRQRRAVNARAAGDGDGDGDGDAPTT